MHGSARIQRTAVSFFVSQEGVSAIVQDTIAKEPVNID